jgi:uncharacterized protein (TIGR02646 family)
MIRLRRVSLPSATLAELQHLQARVDGIITYEQRVSRAKLQFSQSNTINNATFREVKKALTKMCSGARRCVYCEDSYADEVEHIKPKELYPEETFVWGNYVYACGPCNGPKNNHFAVFASGSGAFTEVTRKRFDPVVEPRQGSPVLINPRWEDPLRFMELDLLGTFIFLPTKPSGSTDYVRAEYTIQVLRLNDRDMLLKARKEAYDSYEARLSQYITVRDQGESRTRLDNRIRALKRMHHPTVWREMKRQHNLIPTLKQLFEEAPEALGW